MVGDLTGDTQDLVTAALTMAVEHRRPAGGVLHHTDRGSQYAATTYRELLASHGLTASMSRRGNCWDNAVVESFFHTLKTELVHHRRYRTREDATQDIFEWIEVFYNRVRRPFDLRLPLPRRVRSRGGDS